MNTTESVNILDYSFIRKNLNPHVFFEFPKLRSAVKGNSAPVLVLRQGKEVTGFLLLNEVVNYTLECLEQTFLRDRKQGVLAE